MIDWRYTDFFPCSYLPQQQARFIGTLGTHLSVEACEQLIMRGFRRSGAFIYWPDCVGCQQCVPVRIAVERFMPNRTQRKLWRRRDQWVTKTISLKKPVLSDAAQTQCSNPCFYDAHFQLYRRYLQARHDGSEMSGDGVAEYIDYMLVTPMDSVLVEFRHVDTNALVMVSLIDRLPTGLSSVYTFFEPDMPKESLGTFAILWQIEWAKRMNRPYVYLGYYIERCRAMAYKRRFCGVEGLIDGVWQPLDCA